RDAAWRDVLLWDEHTWGADRSISEPDSPQTLAQWHFKQRFALDADSASRALLARAAHGGATGRGVDLWNTHAVVRHGVTIIPDSLSRGGDRVRDAAGRAVASQRLQDGALAVRLDLQPMGATRIMIARDGGERDARVPGDAPVRAAGDSLWNGRVVVHVDPRSGAIASVRWRGRELVDQAKGGWDRYRYVLGRDTSRAQDASHTRIDVLDLGPLVATLRVTSDAPGAVSPLVRDVTLHAGSDAIQLVVHLDKAAVRAKEAVHIGFPLAVGGGTVRMEQGWAVVRPDLDQADGANRNLYPVQRWLDASNEEFGVTVVTPDLPLWELNGLTAEAFEQADGREEWLTHSLPGTELVAYAMNNYWHTNFKADQSGPVMFRVVLVPHGAFNAADATHAALEVSEPPVVARAAASAVKGPLFELDDTSVVVSSVAPSADAMAVMVRLWNPTDRAARVGFTWRRGRAPRVWMSSPTGEHRVLVHGRIEVPAMGSVTVRVEGGGERRPACRLTS
ncbi:MAG: hypothetical protein ACRELE_09650, partial [Gemmatimonadales bacterium]